MILYYFELIPNLASDETMEKLEVLKSVTRVLASKALLARRFIEQSIDQRKSDQDTGPGVSL
jgi:hypothetical protein